MMDVQKAILQRWASKSTNLKPVGAILQKKDYHIPHELIEAEEEKEYWCDLFERDIDPMSTRLERLKLQAQGNAKEELAFKLI